jgi:hypothetical protein
MAGKKVEISRGTRIMKWVYWIVGLIALCGLCYFLFNTLDRQISSVLVFLGGVLILYFYYVKWFVAAALNPSWPPYQTLCPDYLTPVTPGEGGVVKCVDFVGVSRNGALKKSSQRDVQRNIANPAYTFTVNPKESSDSLRSRLQSYGLTWVSLFGN